MAPIGSTPLRENSTARNGGSGGSGPSRPIRRTRSIRRRPSDRFPSCWSSGDSSWGRRPALAAEPLRSRMTSMIPVLPFGRTGHQSTRLLFGAAALGNVNQDEADQTMELIRAHGINHIDTAASYGDAELRLGPWIETHRDEFFLATKTGERTRAEAYNEIQRSLERLRTDRIDLIQLHNLVDEEEWRRVFSPGGALEGVVEAKEDGFV